MHRAGRNYFQRLRFLPRRLKNRSPGAAAFSSSLVSKGDLTASTLVWVRCALSWRGRFPDFTLPAPEFCHFVAVGAHRYTAPLPTMIFCGVVEVEHARAGVGATPEVVKVCLGEEESNLASENGERKFVPVQLGRRVDKLTSLLSDPLQRLVKAVHRQQTV